MSEENTKPEDNNVSHWKTIFRLAADEEEHCCHCEGCDEDCTIGIELRQCFICGKDSFQALCLPEERIYSQGADHSQDALFFVCDDHFNDMELHTLLRNNDLYGVLRYIDTKENEFSKTTMSTNK